MRLETEMPGCLLFFFGFVSLVSISFGTKLCKYFGRMPASTEYRIT